MANYINFKCKKKPTEPSLSEFQENIIYRGRSFNGLYHISEKWGSSKPTIMIEKKTFEKFFEIIAVPVDLAAMATEELNDKGNFQLNRAS